MKDILLGMAVGDAVGVPYEFITKGEIRLNPCTDMVGYGTHNQPIGTWSDDSSMAFCMLESLIGGWDMDDMAGRFLDWYRNNYWTPHGVVFDMGLTTQQAIWRYEKGKLPANVCGNTSLSSNGNGSVMRILPIVPYFIDNKVDSSIIRYKMVSDLSSITHGHQLSVMSCFILTEYARHLYLYKYKTDKNILKNTALNSLYLEILEIKELLPFNHDNFDKFNKVLDSDLALWEENEISGSGFCIDTVTAAIYCLLNTDNYRDAVLMAVNLGDDTDTTACVTGGLAGILYGTEGIPTQWVENLVRRKDIINLAKRYDQGKTV